MNMLNSQDVIDALERDHDGIARILANRPRCMKPPGGGSPCQRLACAHGEQCGAAIRKTVTDLLFASIAHFDREGDALRVSVYRADYETHSSEHVVLTETLTNILANYTESGSCLEAIADVDRFAGSIRHHMAATDAPMLRTCPPVDAPSSKH